MKINYKILLVVLAILGIIMGVVCWKNIANVDNNSKNKEVHIVVYDKESELIYDKNASTDKKYLIETLKELEDLQIKTQDSQYGEFITSIKGIEQGDNYYWNYYINDEYAQVGVSSYETNNEDVISFKLEKFE